MDFFDAVPSAPHLSQPAHVCCDNCSKHCACGKPDCKVIRYPQMRMEPPRQQSRRECEVSQSQRIQLKAALITYHKHLLVTVWKQDCRGNSSSVDSPVFSKTCPKNPENGVSNIPDFKISGEHSPKTLVPLALLNSKPQLQNPGSTPDYRVPKCMFISFQIFLFCKISYWWLYREGG